MKMSVIIAIIFLFIICLMPSQSRMDFRYECIGKDATATTYNYLREPRAAETGYISGLKSGSFNYLENGDINLNEHINYDYGNGTINSNSTVSHDLSLEFKGERGISEFFGRGFFGNNRWISAWKKIRYEESPNMEILKRGEENFSPMENYPSDEIKVEAQVYMNTSNKTKTDYEFRYNAEIKNGLIETKDSTGWTNRSGSRRYDWEQESIVKGKTLDITNDLVESARIIPEAGFEGEWLPCCFKGTMPNIEQLEEPWPSYVVKATLKANTLLPTAQLSPVNATFAQLFPPGISISNLAYRRAAANKHAVIGNIGFVNRRVHLSPETFYIPISVPNAVSVYATDSIANDSSMAFYPESKNLKVGLATYMPESQLGPLLINNSHKIEPKTCKDGSCEGYDCIYTYDEGPISEGGAATAGEVPVILKKNLYVTTWMAYLNNNSTADFTSVDGRKVSSQAKHIIYNIWLHNSGSSKLTDVFVTAELEKGINYVKSKYNDSSKGYLKEDSVIPITPNEESKTTVTWKLDTMNSGEMIFILVEAKAKDAANEKGLRVEAKGKAADGDEVIGSDSSPSNQCYLRFIRGQESEIGTECKNPKNPDCGIMCPDWAKPISL